MERLYRTQILPQIVREQKEEVQNPIELDNRSFNLIDGDNKTLDYLDCTGNMVKGHLGAKGVIKLCPYCKKELNKATNPIKEEKNKAPISYPELEETNENKYENDWDNIFLNRCSDDYVLSDAI